MLEKKTYVDILSYYYDRKNHGQETEKGFKTGTKKEEAQNGSPRKSSKGKQEDGDVQQTPRELFYMQQPLS